MASNIRRNDTTASGRPVRVCIASLAPTSHSIARLTEAEFRQRVQQASQGRLEVSFLLGGYPRESEDASVRRARPPGWLPRWLGVPLAYLRHLPRLLRQDIIVTSTITLEGAIASLFCRLFRKRCMVTVHGFYDREWQVYRHYSRLKLARNWLMAGLTRRLAHLFVTIDEQLQQDLIGRGVSPAKTMVRPVPADSDRFSRRHLRADALAGFKEEYGLPEHYLLFVGRMDQRDGILDALEVFRRVHAVRPHCRLVLLCQNVPPGMRSLGPDAREFTAANNLDDTVTFIDEAPHDQMPYLYALAGVVIMPLHPPACGPGKITLEALSMEVPVIITDIGTFHKVVFNGENGYRLPVGDVEGMARRVLEILADPELGKRLGARGREIVKARYDMPLYIQNWVESLLGLAAQP